MNKPKAAFKIARAFFVLGTLFLLIQLVFRGISFITIMGYYYLLLAIGINCILVVLLLIDLIWEKRKLENVKAIGILLLNLPIAFVYAHIVLEHLI